MVPSKDLRMNTTMCLPCAVCEEVKSIDVDAFLREASVRLSKGVSSIVYRCCKECVEMYDLNPLPYEKNSMDTKEFIIKLTLMKFGITIDAK